MSEGFRKEVGCRFSLSHYSSLIFSVICSSAILLLATALLVTTAASAAPLDSDYKKVRKKTLQLKECEMISGVRTLSISSDGKSISLPRKLSRGSYNLRKKYRFFACGANDSAQIAVFAKRTQSGLPVEFLLTLDDFPESTGVSCSSWPGTHIYKTIGSSHFTDVRRNTVGLILKIGARGPYPSCVEAKDTAGNTVAKLGLYARGAGWAARYYAGIGCGSGTPLNGSAIASRARKNTGSSQIIMDFGSSCYGPIDATRCIGSAQC